MQSRSSQLFRRFDKTAFFILTILLCTALTFFFLRLVLRNGLTGDDWQLLFAYKTFDQEPLGRIFDAWRIRGPYTTVQFYYIGLLEKVVGFNYLFFQVVNILFKIFASVTLFILLLGIFKDRILAFLGAVIFSIIHSSAGALLYVVKGTEYLAMGFMNLFFLLYYQSINKNSIKKNLIASGVLFVTLMLSPIRMYPLLGLIFIVEIIFNIKNKTRVYFKKSLLRLTIFFLPLLIPAIASIGSSGTIYKNAVFFANSIGRGELHYITRVFDGLGYSLLGADELEFFGSFREFPFEAYLFYLIKPILAFFIATLFLSLVLKNKIHFIINSLLIAAFLFIFLYFTSAFNNTSPPASLLGASLAAWSIGYLIYWLGEKRSVKYFLLFLGPILSLFFLFSTLLVVGEPFGFSDAVHRYLIVSSLGITLFISSLISLFLEDFLKLKKITYFICGLLILISVAFVSYYEINKYYSFYHSLGVGSKEQNYMQNQILNSVKGKQNNLLVYFEGLEYDPSLVQYHEVSSNLGYFDYWMLYFKDPQFIGCISYLTDKKKLQEAYNKVNFNFEVEGLCGKNRYDIAVIKNIYNISEFRAFLFKDKKLLNITNRVLNELKNSNL